MSLSFFSQEENQELVQRIELARETEDKRHIEQEGFIVNDCSKRGLTSSTVYTADLMQETLKHLRNIAVIVLDEIFLIIKNKRIGLLDKHAGEITAYIKEPTQRNAKNAQRKLASHLNARGMSMFGDNIYDASVIKMINSVSINEVVVRAKDWNQELSDKKKTSRSGKSWEILKYIISGVIGGIIMLIVIWIKNYLQW